MEALGPYGVAPTKLAHVLLRLDPVSGYPREVDLDAHFPPRPVGNAALDCHASDPPSPSLKRWSTCLSVMFAFCRSISDGDVIRSCDGARSPEFDLGVDRWIGRDARRVEPPIDSCRTSCGRSRMRGSVRTAA